MARPRQSRPTQREAMLSSGLQPKAGLGQMLAQQGAGKDLVDAADQIESMPGGMELLYTVAAEEMMKKQGMSKSDAKKVRLYKMGGRVPYRKGGSTMEAAEQTRKAGRGDDSMMLHVSPEEYEVIESMWGPAETNPDTGIGEYGFLSKVWKKLKKGVKKVVKSKIFQVVAPIALSIFVPGLGAAIGGALGASGTTAGVIGNAVVQGGLGAVSGGKEGFLKGAVMGGVTGGLGKMAGTQVSKVAPGLSDRTANVIGSSLASGVGSELTGGDFTQGAIMGGLGEFARPGMESLAEKGRSALGLEEVPGQLTAQRITEPGAPPPYTGAPGSEFGPVPDIGRPGSMQAGPPQGAYTPPPPPGAAPPGGGDGFDLGRLGDLAPLALAALPLMSGSSGETVEGEPGELPPHMMESLPLYTMNREFQGLPSEADYYTYGQPGAPQSGQHLFITPPDPFGGIGPIGGEGEQQGGLGQAAPPTAVDPNAIPGAGQIPGSGTPGRQRNQPLFDQYGNRVAARGGYQRGGEFDFWAQNEDIGRASPSVSAQGRYVKGAGTGRSDDIEALLSDGEYVMDAESVALLGDGSGDAGARRLDEMRANLRKHKGEKLRKGGFSHKAKRPDQYMGRLRAAAGRT